MVAGREPVGWVLKVGEVVVDYAVVRREEASGDGIVVGEGEGREDGDEAFVR